MENNFNNQMESQLDSEPQYNPQFDEAAQPSVDYIAMSAEELMGAQPAENVIAGVVGAFVLSLLGGAVYFGVYQLGYIAGICGLIIFVLANWGYQKFSGCKASKKGVWVSIIMMVVMILLAEYVCLAFEIFNIFKVEYSISFTDALRATPEFLKEGEVLGAAIKDVVIALALGIFAAFSSIRNAAKKSAK